MGFIPAAHRENGESSSRQPASTRTTATTIPRHRRARVAANLDVCPGEAITGFGAAGSQRGRVWRGRGAAAAEAVGRRGPLCSSRSWLRGRVLGMAIAMALGLLLLLPESVEAASKTYELRETVPVIGSNVFPYSNPAETYQYYSLPFCPSADGKKEERHFGELLVGSRKVSTPYKLHFKSDRLWDELCTQTIEPSTLQHLFNAIQEEYYFELFIDDVSVMGPIGRADGIFSPHVYLFTHLSFIIGYNGDQIVSVRTENVEEGAEQMNAVKIYDTSQPMLIKWTYSVRWQPEDTRYSERAAKIASSADGSRLSIHWLSIINSFVLVLILTVFLGIILLKVIRNDFSKYMDADEDDIGEEESGWKLVHGDVFRFPRHINLFAALTGAGAQLCVTTVLLLVCAVLGVVRVTKPGSILTCLLVLYSLTSWVAGLMSGRLYRQLGGKFWVWNSILVSLVFPAPLTVVFSVVNSIAWQQSSTAAIPFNICVGIGAMFFLITFPLTVVGAIAGRNTASDFKAPCRTTRVPRQVPKDIPWYRRYAAHMFMSGFLPFSAIYIELHYIYDSVWGHQIYTMFGILILAFGLLLIVCSFITVALIYFQLGCEDHRWWWRSFFSGGATGLFMYAYSFFFFFHRSEMHGLLQSSLFFGYMALISYAFFIMLGYVGFASSLTFVTYIYGLLKCD